MEEKRIDITISRTRMIALLLGKVVEMTSGGKPYTVRADMYCCTRMKEIASLSQSKEMLKGLEKCPYCQAPIVAISGVMSHAGKEGPLKGRSRIYNLETLKESWLKPNQPIPEGWASTKGVNVGKLRKEKGLL